MVESISLRAPVPGSKDSPKCNNTEINQYLRMLINPPLVDTKLEMPCELCERGDIILEPTFLTIDNWLSH